MKLSKQTIFTLLGILVIAGSIPLAVILVKQRQELRKEAAGTCGDYCASVVGHADYPWCICNADRSPDSNYQVAGQTTTSDCTRSCVAYSPKSSGGVTSTPTPKPVSGQTCGSWCASQVGHADFPWCICNADRSSDSNYQEAVRTTTYDCTRSCVAYRPKSAPTPTGQNCGSFCASKVGHADFPWCICNADRSPATGYQEAARTTTSDCTKSCVAYSSSEDYKQAWGKPVWGLYQTGRTCSVPTPTPTPTVTPTPTGTPTPTPTKTPTPTPTGTVTPTPTPSGTPTPTPTGTTPTPTPTPTGTVTPTPTPTIPVSCDQVCSSDGNCTSGLICYNSRCRNSNCPSETDCTCPGPTPTPTATSTPGPTATPTTVAQATPTPVVELPKAGFALPTFGAIIGGILLIIASLIFIL